MNDTDLHEMFAAAVTSPAADRIDLEAVLRGGRRRHRTRVAATVGAVAGVLVVAGALVLGVLPGSNEYHVRPAYQTGSPSVDPTEPVHATTSQQAAPPVLAVACSPTGITVSSDVVAAQPGGVVLRVSSTLPGGAYLTHYPAPGGGFSSFGTGGGDELPADPATWTLSAPPGPLTLGCTVDGDVVPRSEVTVSVLDPGGYWQPTTLDDLGCAPRGISDWAGGLGGAGATREEAVAGVVRAFGALLGTSPVVTAAHLGYVEARDQYWIASKNGAAYITIRTWPTAQGFSAYPDLSC